MLTCDFSFCIYQAKGFCTLSSVDINGVGMCDSAVTIDLTDEELWQRKQKLLVQLKNEESGARHHKHAPHP